MKFFEQLKYVLFGAAAICLIAQNVNSFDCEQVTIICLMWMCLCYELTKKSS